MTILLLSMSLMKGLDQVTAIRVLLGVSLS